MLIAIAIVVAVWMLLAGILIGYGIGDGEYARAADDYDCGRGTVVVVFTVMALTWPIWLLPASLLSRKSASDPDDDRVYMAALGMDVKCWSSDYDDGGKIVHCFSDAIPEPGTRCNCGSTAYRIDGYCATVAA